MYAPEHHKLETRVLKLVHGTESSMIFYVYEISSGQGNVVYGLTDRG